MSTLLSCQACGWSRTFGWPEPARHAALHHMCETPPTATGVVAETATRPDARPVPSEQTQPKPEPPAGGGQPPAGVDRPASTTGAASRQRSAHRMVPAPVYADDRLALYAGDAIDVLSGLPDNHVDCAVTSPPYWGLRTTAPAAGSAATATATTTPARAATFPRPSGPAWPTHPRSIGAATILGGAGGAARVGETASTAWKPPPRTTCRPCGRCSPNCAG